ncbi:hypothetical protein ACQR36_17450 [Rhodococcus erythropolis]|uniref:hypothetical protein n=1 Tax=Rhodococcus erythropolis TaxID=1833 RepID=UPI001E3538F7|nr:MULTISPECIES: hypothetical protein [Rhodococcus erythropolis group]MCD2104908.1 hypothetical protein [Rhodococcus qingshengii]MCZ4526431.1 hypothetical protein [Rhodococcus erythropolis]
MGLFDGPTWQDRMLYEAEEQTRAAQKAAKDGQRRARENAAANAEIARLAKKREAREVDEANQRQQQARSQAVSAQQAAQQAQRQAARQHQAQLESQVNANWAMFRQTPDGQQWQRWIDAATQVSDLLDAWNQVWSEAVLAAVAEERSNCAYPAWQMGVYLPVGHPGTRLLGSMRALMSIAKAAREGAPDVESAFHKMQLRLAKKNPAWATENELNRRGWIDYAVRRVGVDPLTATAGSIPGYLVDDLNWSVPSRYRSIVVNIKRQLPPASEIGSCLNVARALKPADVFDHPELRRLIEQMHTKSTSV